MRTKTTRCLGQWCCAVGMKQLILTCEHGDAKIPIKYKNLFQRRKSVLKTHRALDIGALAVAKDLERNLNVSLDYCTVSRLVIDTNRFLDSATLFSEFTNSLTELEKSKIIDTYYLPHWKKVTKRVQNLTTTKKSVVLHVAIHSMTDRLNGKNRPMQLALLYNPKHKTEKQLASLWIKKLRQTFPHFQISRNNPYKGDGEGLTTWLRNSFQEKSYLGIELEINQKFLKLLKTTKQRKKFSEALANSLKETLHDSPSLR